MNDKGKEIHDTKLNLSSLENYLSEFGLFVHALSNTTNKIRNIWTICNATSQTYGRDVYFPAKTAITKIRREELNYEIETQLFHLFPNNKALSDGYFRLSKENRETLHQVIGEIKAQKVLDDADLERLSRKLIEMFEGNINDNLKKILDEVDFFSKSSFISFYAFMVVYQKEELMDKLFNLNVTSTPTWEYRYPNIKKEIVEECLHFYQNEEMRKDPTVLFSQMESYWTQMNALFSDYTPDQLLPLSSNNKLESLLLLHRMYPDILPLLIEIKFQSRIDQEELQKGTALVINESVLALAKELPIQDHSMLKIFLGSNDRISEEIVRHMQPIVSSCLTLIKQGTPSPVIRSFLSKLAVLMSTKPALALLLAKIPTEHLEAVIRAMQNVKYLSKLEKTDLIDLLKKEGLEENLIKSDIIKIKDIALIQKMVEDFHTKKPDLRRVFDAWFDQYMAIQSRRNLTSTDQKLESMEPKDLKTIRQVIKTLMKCPDSQALDAFALAQQYPLHIQKCLELAMTLENDSTLMPQFIEFAKKHPKAALEFFTESKRSFSDIKQLIEIKNILEQENAEDLLEPILPWFFQQFLAPDLTIFRDKAVIENIRDILKIEKEMNIKILSNFSERNMFIVKWMTDDPEFKKAFLVTQSLRFSPAGLIDGLSENPDTFIKLIKITNLHPEAFKFLADEVDHKTAHDPDLIHPRLMDLFDQKESPKLLNNLVSLLEENQLAVVRGLLDLWNDNHLDPTLRHELVKTLADRARLITPEIIEQCLKIFKDQAGTPLASALRMIVQSPIHTGLIETAVHMDLKNDQLLLERIVLQGGCDALSTGVLTLMARGKKSMAMLLEKSFNLTEQDPTSQRMRQLYPLLNQRNYLLAEQLLSKEGEEWEAILNIPSGKIQEQLIAFLSYREHPSTQSIVDFAFSLATRKEFTEAEMSKALAILSYCTALSAKQVAANISHISNQDSLTQIVEDISQNIESPETRLTQLLNQYDVKKDARLSFIPDVREEGFFEAKKNILNATEVTLALSECLLLPSGEINTALIPILKDSDVLRSINLDPNSKNHILYTLDVLTNDPEFSTRIKDAPVPPPGSPGEKIIKHMLHMGHNVAITPFHVRQVLLSGLLSPTRQAKIGSCFATSLVIQHDSYPMGLKQKLEDFLALTTYGKISRSVWIQKENTSVTMDLPALVEDLLIEPSIQHDHLLNRVREFTLSSFSALNPEQKFSGLEDFISTIKWKIEQPIQNVLDHVDASQAKDLVNQLRDQISGQIAKHLSAAFIACKQDPWQPDNLGAWALLDKNKGEVINTIEEFQQILKDALDEVEPLLMMSIPDQKKIIQEVFNEKNGLKAYVDSLSTDIKSEFYQLIEKNRPWIKYESGGIPENVSKIYFERSSSWKKIITSPSDHKQNFFNLINSINHLPEPIREYCREQPNFRVPLNFPGHALSFKPSVILNSLDQGKTVDELVEDFTESCSQWLDTPLSEEAKKRLLTILNTNTLKISPNRFEHVFQHPDLQKFTTIRELFSTFDQLLIEMTGDNLRMRRALRDIILKTLITDPLFKQESPPLLEIGDTNWDNLSRFGFIPYPETGDIMPAFENADLTRSVIKHFEMSRYAPEGTWELPISWVLVDESNLKFTPIGVMS